MLTIALLSAPALAGEAEITLKGGAASLALAFADLDPDGGWIAVDAEPAAGRAKADILIEALATGGVAFAYDPRLLREPRVGSADQGSTSVYCADSSAGDGGDGALDVLFAREPAELAGSIEAVWDQNGAVCLAYVVVDPAGGATVVLPSVELGLASIDPDEID